MQKDKVNTTRPPPTNLHIIMVMCYMYITKKKKGCHDNYATTCCCLQTLMPHGHPSGDSMNNFTVRGVCSIIKK